MSKLSPGHHEPGVADDFAFYGVQPDFQLIKIRRPASRGGSVVHAASVMRQLARLRSETDVVYSRALSSAVIATTMGLPVVFEAHGIPSDRWSSLLWRQMTGSKHLRRLVAISGGLLADLKTRGMVPAHGDSLVAHDGADPLPDVPERELGARPRIGYIGSLYAGRGIELILEVARRIGDARFHLIGGNARDLADWRANGVPPNVELHGFVPPGELPGYYQAFDILLMPYSPAGVRMAHGASDTSRWMSPLKLFEYMSTGAAIVATRMPVLEEVLAHEQTALLADYTAEAWESAIRRLLGNAELRDRLGSQARTTFLASHTWDARARAVLAGL